MRSTPTLFISRIGRGKTTPKDLSPGDELSLAGRDIEVLNAIILTSGSETRELHVALTHRHTY